MSRIAFIALAAGTLAFSAGTASAGYSAYGYGPSYGGYAQPCCAPVPPPPPCCAPAPYYTPQYAPYPIVVPAPQPAVLPPPPLVGLGERGPKYYSGHGYSRDAGPCYQQYVRVPDRFGGWAWGLRSGCDTH
jgi:hypothetical protein